MARRAQGKGSISRRSDGRWQRSIQVNGKRQFVYGKTQGEVAEKLRRLAGQAQGVGQLPSAGSMSVAEFLKEWLSQASTRLRPTTYRLYEGIARLHVSPHIETVKLSKLAPLKLVRLYAELTRAGLSARRVQQLHLFLNKALGDAVRWGLIGSNPAASAQPPRPQRKERNLWRPDQIRTFLASAGERKCGQYGYLFGFLLASGCRVREALGLR